MDLVAHLKPELWQAISSAYEAHNYTAAILDAMHCLSDTLREKAGLDGDGQALVGQALGGTTPPLRINKLQTQSERDQQKGLEHLLRGLYLAVRNPRSHQHFEDTPDIADPIIYFIDHLLRTLDHSSQPFTLDDFIDKVVDPDFHESKRYASLLAAEIPSAKRLDTLIEIYRRKTQASRKALKLMVEAITALLPDDLLQDFLDVVSDELRKTASETDIRLTLHILAPDMWPRITEPARLRIEGKLVKNMSRASYGKPSGGALATWSRKFLPHFTLKQDVAETLCRLLQSPSPRVRRYVTHYWLPALPIVVLDRPAIDRSVTAISHAIRRNDTAIRDDLLAAIDHLPKHWQQRFLTTLQDLTDPNNPAKLLTDGTPFLTHQDEDDEIPF